MAKPHSASKSEGNIPQPKKRVKKSQINKAGAAKTGIINFKRQFKIDSLLKTRKHKYKDDLQ